MATESHRSCESERNSNCMKTAKEWHHTPQYIKTVLSERDCKCISCNRVKQIQLDAYKQGMIEAADMINVTRIGMTSKQAILTTANNLTKLPE